MELPKAGVWRASLAIGEGRSLAPVALRVATGDAPGAAPYEISSIGDLSGAAARRCRSFQLGLVLSLGLPQCPGRDRRAEGRRASGRRRRRPGARPGVGGGRPRRQAGRSLRTDGGGDGRRSSSGACRSSWPTPLRRRCQESGSSASPVTPTPKAGPPPGPWPAAASSAGPTHPGGCRWSSRRDDPGRRADRRRRAGGAGARSGLGRRSGGRRDRTARPTSRSSSDRHEPGTPLFPVVQEAVNGDRYTATFLAAEPVALGAALDQLSDIEIVSNAALLVASRSFDETFLRSSKIGRRGDVKVYGEVAPDSGDSLLYTRLVSTIFPGEQATVDGLRGFMAGKAITAGLDKGTSTDGLVEHLKVLTLLLRRCGLRMEPGRSGGGIVALPPLQGQLHPRRSRPRPRRRAGPLLRRRRRLEPGRHRQRRPVRPATLGRRAAPALRGRRPGNESVPFGQIVEAAEQLVGLVLREPGDLNPTGEG